MCVEKLSLRDILVRGSVLAAVITVPSLIVFLGLWMVTGDLLMPAIAGAVVHFVAMGFSLKFSKKFLVTGGRGR